MFAVLWFLLIAFVVTFSLVWLLDHNGEVVITWLGYQLQTDVMTSILLTSLLSLLLFFISYLLARVLAIKFPALLKALFRRSYVRSLEKVIKRHHEAFDNMSKMLLALEAGDDRSAKNLQKNLAKTVKHAGLNNYFSGKIAYEEQQFSKATEYFSKFGENRHAKLLVLQSHLEKASKNNEPVKVVAYAKQILSVQKDNLVVARKLFAIYKEAGAKVEMDEMISEYGIDELTKSDAKRQAPKLNFFQKLFSKS